MKENRVFLGGTCNETTWRNELIPMLTNVEYFNPVVEDWTPECQAEEERQKKICRYHLYVITPRMTGTFSIAEIIESAHTPEVITVVYVRSTDYDDDGNTIGFNVAQTKSLNAVTNLAKDNNAIICKNLTEVADVLNNLSNTIDDYIEELSNFKCESADTRYLANVMKSFLISLKYDKNAYPILRFPHFTK